MAKNDFQYSGWNSYTLQCGMWLWNHDSEFTKWQHPAMCQVVWDDMLLNSPKRPPYWNSTSGFDFDHHRSRHVILHQSAKFYPNRTTLSRKRCRHVDFKMADLRHLGFQRSSDGFSKKPITTS